MRSVFAAAFIDELQKLGINGSNLVADTGMMASMSQNPRASLPFFSALTVTPQRMPIASRFGMSTVSLPGPLQGVV